MQTSNDFSGLKLVTIFVIGLYGEPYEFSKPLDVIKCIENMPVRLKHPGAPLDGIRVTAIYETEETIHGYFKTKTHAKQFVERFIGQ